MGNSASVSVRPFAVLIMFMLVMPMLLIVSFTTDSSSEPTVVWGDQDWALELVDGTGVVGSDSSMVLDGNNRAHVSYYDATNGDLKYSNNLGGPWSSTTIDSEGDVGRYSSISIDALGNIHISYYDATNGDLKYASNAGGTWATSAVDQDGDVGSRSSVALDASNKVHISYYDTTNGDLKYANNIGGLWSASTIDSFGDVGSFSSIRVGSDSIARIAYFNMTDGSLRFATNSGGVWSSVLVGPGFGQYVSMALDASNNVHIACYDQTNSDLRYVTNTGGTWSSIAVDETDDVGQYPSLAVDSSAKVHIAYYRATGSDLRYATNSGGSWAIETVDDVGNVGEWASLKVDTSNKAHITYFDSTNGDLKKVTNSFWSMSRIDLGNDVGQHTSVAYDSQDNVYIAYQDFTTKDLKLASRVAGVWTITTLLTIGSVGMYASLDIDSNDKLHICYYNQTTGDLEYITNSGGSWSRPLILDSTGDVGQYASLAIDQLGYIHISYYEGGSAKTRDLKYVTNAGGSWGSPERVDASSNNVGEFTSIAVDASNNVHICYYDVTAGDLKYVKKTGSVWGTPSIIDSTGNVGEYTSMVIDPAQSIHISYYDQTNGNLKYAVNPGSAWTLTTIDSTGDVGQYTSLAIDANGKVHISYYGASSSDLKYSTNAGGTWKVSSLDIAGNIGMFTSIALDSSDRICISYYETSNGNLKVATQMSVPSAPRDLVATSLSGSVQLSWGTPTNDHGFPIVGYQIFRGDSPESISLLTTVGPQLSYVDGSTPTGTHYYRVAAINAVGIGPMSNVASASVVGMGPPTGLAAIPGPGQVSISWNAPASDGGSPVVNYSIYRGTVPNGETLLIKVGNVMTFDDLDVVNGVTYYYKVSAWNELTEGPLSSEVSAKPYGLPDAPTDLQASGGNAQVTLTWTAPADNGAVIDHYIVYRDGEDVAHPTSPIYIDTGLTNGVTYTYAVAAHNLAGVGPQSSSVSSMPIAVPGAPTALQATPGNAQVSLTWTAPVNIGGSPIDHYIVYRDGSDIAHPTTNSYIDSGLTNGITYTYTVAAHNSAGIGMQSTSASATPFTVPGAPTNLQATPGNTQVSLTWTAPSSNGSPIDHYIVYRDGSDIAHPTTASYIDTGLTNGQTYSYKVVAHNSAGTGPESATVTAKPAAVPDAPTNLEATPSNAQVSLSWTAPSGNGASIDYYIIYRNGADIAHPTSTSYLDSGLTNGMTYSYTVAAHSTVGTGPQSSSVQAIPFTVPGAPTNLQATPSNAQVVLTWTAPSSNGATIDYYIVYRNGNDLAHPTAATYTDTGLTNGASYTYNVVAHNKAGIGPSSSSISATPYTVPGEPTGLTAVAGDSQVSLAWTAPSANGSPIDYYIVYRNAQDIGHPTGTSYVATGLSNGVTYTFTVVAHNAAGNGPSSSQATATPMAVPSAPSNVQAVPGDTYINISWAKPSSDGGSAIVNYQVWRGPSATSLTLYSNAGTALWFNDTGLTNGQAYYYAIRAENSKGVGPSSAVVNAVPSEAIIAPSAPQGLEAVAGNGVIDLTWAAPSNNGGSQVTGYRIYRGTSPSTGTLLITLGDVLEYSDVSVTNGVTYYYRISAENAIGEGPMSLEASATPFTVPNAPTELSAVPGNGQVALSWQAPSDNGATIDHYVVYRDGTAIGYPTTTSFLDNGLTNGVPYQYSVSAKNAAGEGPSSVTVTSTPLTVPGMVKGLQATAGNERVTISWAAPDYVGPLPTIYHLFRDGTEIWSGTGTTYTDFGVEKGVEYTYSIMAENVAGAGALSEIIFAVPFGVPGAPDWVSSVTDDGSVILSWSVPDYVGPGAVTYRLYRDGTEIYRGPLTTYHDDGLINEQEYVYNVAASNSVGVGGNSTMMVIVTHGPPSVVQDLKAEAGDGYVTLTWKAPAYIGLGDLTYYLYRDGSLIWSGVLLTYLDLYVENNITYSYNVAAENDIGHGANGTSVTARPAPTPPRAPTEIGANATDAMVFVQWKKPNDPGSRPVLAYNVYRANSSGQYVLIATVTGTNFTDWNVTNGEEYRYKVSAVNSIGEGAMTDDVIAMPEAEPVEESEEMTFAVYSLLYVSMGLLAGIGGTVAGALLLSPKK